MANVKISNLPVETVLANMTGIAGYNASGTAQISGATIDSAFAKSSSDLQFIVDNGNIIDSNAGTGNIVFKNGSSSINTTMSVNSISSDTSFSIIGTTNNTNLTFTSGGELRFTPNASLGTPNTGYVLRAKNTQGDVEWSQFATASPLPDVLANGFTGNSGQQIDLVSTTGGTVTQYSQPSIVSAGTFSITQGNNSLLTLGTSLSPTTILGGAGSIQIGDSGGNLLISTNGSDKLQLSANSTGEVQFYLGSNNPAPAIGDVLTAKTTNGDVHWTTPSSGGGLDFSSLNIATIKADLTASSQTQYGQAITVKAAAAIDNGAVVIWDYSGTEVQAKMPSGATPDQHEVIGIAIEDIALGATGKVLVYGYVTAKFVPVAGNVVTSVLLDGSSNINGGTTIVSDVNNSTSFQDEGGTGSSYSPNSNYTHTFYNNGGDISMEFVNWDIEQGSGSTQLWDRLGFTVSNDGTTFQNAEFTPHVAGASGGWRRSTNGIAPWSENESQGSFPSGYILAEQPSTTFPAGSVINTGYKYVRAYFIDDGSTQQAGWEINVYGTQTLSNSSVVAGESVFINPNDLTATSGSGATGRRIGNYVGSDVTNNAVVMFIAPARPQA